MLYSSAFEMGMGSMGDGGIWGSFFASFACDCKSTSSMTRKKTHIVGVRACTASKEIKETNTTKQEK